MKMNHLIKKIKELEISRINYIIKKRLKEFGSFKNKNKKEWFSELCFCILTANSKANSALKIQGELGVNGFCECSLNDVKKCIMKHKHRFHNNKTNYIIEARKYIDIKSKIQQIIKKKGELEAREWLVQNIKGIGYKEASHFLRNVGYRNIAILDRHILNLMLENNYIEERPKTLTKKKYLYIEEIFKEIADNLKMSMAELDLYMWYMKTGEVLK